MQLYFVWRQMFALGHQRAECQKQQRTVRLDNNLYATSNRPGKNLCESDLCFRVEMNLRLLQIHSLPLLSSVQCHDHGQNLRRAKANICDVDQVACTTTLWAR